MKQLMHKHLPLLLITAVFVFMWACESGPILPDDTDTEENDLTQIILDAQAAIAHNTGNDAPNGAHYNLNIYADLDGDGTAERYPLFDEALQDCFWSYDNNGLKLLQLRFYPVPSDVNG